MGNNLELIDRGKDFLKGITIAQAIRTKINEWDLMNSKVSVLQWTASFSKEGGHRIAK